jgi:hypothetical protein
MPEEWAVTSPLLIVCGGMALSMAMSVVLRRYYEHSTVDYLQELHDFFKFLEKL